MSAAESGVIIAPIAIDGSGTSTGIRERYRKAARRPGDDEMETPQAGREIADAC